MTRISDQSSLEMFSNARWITEQLINRYKRLSLQIISIKRDSSIPLKNLNDFLKTILLLFENVFRAKGMSFLLNSLAPAYSACLSKFFLILQFCIVCQITVYRITVCLLTIWSLIPVDQLLGKPPSMGEMEDELAI